MRFDADFLTELKNNNEIVSLISSYLPLKKAGRLMSAVCPFHPDKSPSFMVYPDTQSFYCFGCGAGGDVITFVMRQENLEYVEAIRFLAERAGMDLPEGDMEREATDIRRRIYEMNKESARFFHAQLLAPQGKGAMEYLAGRGFDLPILKRFGVGFAPDSYDALKNHLKNLGYSEPEMLQATLVFRSSKTGKCYDNFRNRVMFPVFDLRGNVIAFSGRTLDKEDKRKYLNSGDTPVFQKSRHLFAMNFAKNKASDFLILCEGNLDVVALHRAGFENAAASLGTALTDEQARIIASYTKEVVLSFDSDEAGKKATARATELLKARGLGVRVLQMQGAKDPDEYIKKYGATRFAKLIAESVDAITWQLEREKGDTQPLEIADKSAYLAKILPTLANLSYVERDLQIARISEELSIARNAIEADLAAFLKKKQKWKEAADKRDFSIAGKETVDKINPQANRHFKAAKAEEWVLGWLLSHPADFNLLSEKLTADDFVTDFNRRVAKTLFSLLEESASADLSYFTAEFSPEEVGRISGMMAKLPPIADPVAVMRDCADTILAEKNKLTADKISDLEDEDLLAFMKDLKKKKS